MQFLTYPANFNTEQTGSGVNVSDRSLKTSVVAGTIALAVGGQAIDTVAVITSGASSVGGFTASSTPPNNRSFYLKAVGDRQYTLFQITQQSSNYSLVVVGGRVYRVMLMKLLHYFDSNKFFRSIQPATEDRTGVEHVSLRGNANLQRRAGADVKREIQFEAPFQSRQVYEQILDVQNNHSNFGFVANEIVEPDQCFPAFFSKPIQTPYASWYWKEYTLNFAIKEQ